MRVKEEQQAPEDSMTSKLANMNLNRNQLLEGRHSTALVKLRRGNTGHALGEAAVHPTDLVKHGRRARDDMGYHDEHRDSSTERSTHSAKPPVSDNRRWGPMKAAAGAALFAGDDNDNPRLSKSSESTISKDDQREWEGSVAGENATISMGDRNFRPDQRSNKPQEHSLSQSLTRQGDGSEHHYKENDSRLRRDYCS